MSTFLIGSFAASWVLWVPMLLWRKKQRRELDSADGGEPLAGLPVMVGLTWFVGSWSPSLVAVALTAREGGVEAIKQLLGRLVEWNVWYGWNVAAVLGPAAVGLLAVGWHVARGGSGVRIAPRRFLLVVVSLVAALPFGPLGEELGWRGFALPELLERQSGLASAVVIGLFWAAWHVPLFWAPLGTSVSGSRVTLRAIGIFVAELLAASVIMTWLYVATSGSLWIAVLFHAAWNAEAHRFLFEPFDDDVADRVGRLTVLALVAVAIALIVWPRLSWRM